VCSDLTNATNINRALTQVFLLMAQGRISQKQAVAFGYIAQLLLQTLPGVRSEFVSVYDPNSWRAKLQASLEKAEENDHADDSVDPDDDDDPPAPSKLVLNKSDERRVSLNASSEKPRPVSAPVNRSPLTEREAPQSSESKQEPVRVAEVITLAPRSSPPQEPSSQATENLASAAPLDDFKQPVIGVVERQKGALSRESHGDQELSRVSESRPFLAHKESARDFYGNPIPPADSWKSLPGAAAVIERASQSRADKPDPPSLCGSTNTPHPRPLSSPQANTTLTKSKSCSSNPHSDKRNRHTTAWFAPASWSGRPQPDPYPSGREKLRGKFRSIANSALRRIQHQNSRGFWSPNTKSLAT